MAKKVDNQDQPVTQREFNSAMGAIKTDMDSLGDRLGGVEGRLDGVETRLGGVEGRLDSLETKVDVLATKVDGLQKVTENVFEIVQSIDVRLAETSDHSERIERLENEVFKVR